MQEEEEGGLSTHQGGEMKAIPRGLNTELEHDFGADSPGGDHFIQQSIFKDETQTRSSLKF